MQASMNSIPGRHRLVGHALKMRKDFFAVIDSGRTCGDIAILWLGPRPAYVVTHPELIHQLLAAEDRKLDKGPLYENLARLIGSSIGTLIGDEHRTRRRILTPAYSSNPQIMAEVAAELFSSWQPGREYDMALQMRRYSFTVMARSLFSGAISPEAEREFVDLLPIALAGIAKYMADPTGLVKRIPTRDNRRIDHALARLKTIIEEATVAYRREGADRTGILAAISETRDPRTGERLSTKEVRNEAMVMMSAGSETVAGVLAYACDIIGRHPDVAARLRAEADRVIESVPLTADDLGKLEFTKRVITEVLRLFPPGALMSRRTIVEIDLGGHRIPPGSAIFFCPYLLHRRADLYSDPDVFDPDRWLPERAAVLARGAFMPFGAGPHICIGEQIAWNESLIAIATISRLWNFSPVPGRAPRPVLAPTLNLDAVPTIVESRAVAETVRLSG